MLLSIGMIVKNEEKYLERCLTALKPILENVDSELIIADTGSTDRTVEIAKQFTDNVFYFEWIKDFSAARNSTLEKAKGEWYMFLDADEIFEGCDELIEFFNSGEYKKYNSASYIVRSIHTDMKSYSDFDAPRLTKILPETKFVLPVHESLNTYNNPIRRINDIAIHYGYSVSSREDVLKKFKRNSELLLKRFEEEKGKNPLLYMQLFDCFVVNDPERAMEYMEMGIKRCLEINDRVIIALYAEKASYYLSNNQFDQVIDICNKYFELPSVIRPFVLSSDAEITGLKATALYKKGEKAASVNEYIKFINLYREVKRGTLRTSDTLMYSFSLANEINYPDIIYDFTEACISTGKYNTAVQYLKSVPISKYADDHNYIVNRLEQEFEIMRHVGYKNIADIYRQLDEFGKERFTSLIRREIAVSDNKKAMFKALMSMKNVSGAFAELIRIYNGHYCADGIDIKNAEGLLKENPVNKYPDMLYLLAAENKDISVFLNAEGCDIGGCLKFCFDCFDDAENVFAAYNAENISDRALPGALKFGRAVIDELLRRKKDISVAINLYGAIGQRYAETMLSADAADNIRLLPSDIAAAVIIGNIVRFREERNYKACVAQLSMLIRVDPDAAQLAGAVKDIIRAEQEKMSANAARSEMDMLAMTIKENIRNYIKSGNINAAVNTLAEYEKINPLDMEIDELKKQLAQM